MWKDAYLESRVLTASPAELVLMVYDYALKSVREARHALAAGNIPGRSAAIGKAIAAVAELDRALDHSAGAAIGSNLAELYAYFRQRLTEANIRQQDPPLAEVESLLVGLSDAWKACVEPRGQKPVSDPVWNEPEFACSHAWSA